MMSGRVVAAGIALVTMPIVARLFTPGDFGVVSMFLSIVGIISHISALQYEGALVLPKEEEALTLMAFTYRIVCCASGIHMGCCDMAGAGVARCVDMASTHRCSAYLFAAYSPAAYLACRVGCLSKKLRVSKVSERRLAELAGAK